MTQTILAIDNGTQSIRALLFDPQGNLLAKSKILLEAYRSPEPGWAEQEPEYFWTKLCEVCNKLWAETDIPRESIVGVALTTQRSTVINVDPQGRPLRPAIIWLDQRRTEGLSPVKGLWGMGFRLTGMRETVAYLQAEAEANWIRTHQPDIWNKTHKFLFLSGYLTHRLTGEFIDSVSAQVGYIPFDYKELTWASSWDWKWTAVPMPKEFLPDIVPAGQVLGRITKQAAGDTGIPQGLPLVASAADKACEVLGSGGLYPHIGCLSYGTTATLNTTYKRYIEAIPLIPPYPSAAPGYYNLELSVSRGFWMVSWFKEEFGHLERWLADEQGVEPESLLDDLVRQVPPGSLGLILQPYWAPGIKIPGPEAKGAIIGFGDVHTRAHLYRAILEGLAYALREARDRTERRSHVPIKELRVSGGGSQSDVALQITADIFGLPTARPHTFETSGLGAAIDAAIGLGLHADVETAVNAMTRIGKVFEPDPKASAQYDELYNRVYIKMYKRLRKLYGEIRDITGYPGSSPLQS